MREVLWKPWKSDTQSQYRIDIRLRLGCTKTLKKLVKFPIFHLVCLLRSLMFSLFFPSVSCCCSRFCLRCFNLLLFSKAVDYGDKLNNKLKIKGLCAWQEHLLASHAVNPSQRLFLFSHSLRPDSSGSFFSFFLFFLSLGRTESSLENFFHTVPVHSNEAIVWGNMQPSCSDTQRGALKYWTQFVLSWVCEMWCVNSTGHSSGGFHTGPASECIGASPKQPLRACFLHPWKCRVEFSGGECVTENNYRSWNVGRGLEEEEEKGGTVVKKNVWVCDRQ